MPPERGYVDRRHQRRGGLGADPGHREEALVDLVARQRVGHERVELLDVGVEGGYLPGEYPDRDVLAGREPPSRARRGQQRLPEPPGPRRGGARAPGGVREPAPAGGRAPGGPAELGQHRHLPAARRVDRALERVVGLQQGRAQAVLRPGPRGGRELAPRRQVLASIYFSPVSLSRRAVRAKAVSPVALTFFHRFRSRLGGAVPRQVLQPVGPAGYLDQVAVVAHPVRDRARRHVVPEHPAPAADPHVGGDDRRALLVARRYQLEQQVRARAADVEVAELVDDQQPRVGVVLEPLLEDAARRGVLQVLDEPGAVHEPDLAPRPDRLDAQRDGEVRLAHAGAPREQDVLGPLDEPQGRELLDLGARDRRLEVPVEVRQPLDVGEPRRPYALVGDPGLPGGDLDARHLLEGGGEAPLARGDHPHVAGQGRRHLVQPERGEVRLRPDRGAALRDGAHHAPPSESSSARLARAASAMSASARPRLPSRACP